jgi:queuine tRNA-ribosyltransferase
VTLEFSISRTDGPARTGRMETAHGGFSTPAFMPVGTLGTVKGVTPHHLKGTGSEIVLANAYHLYLRPGAEVIRSAGGLHAFRGWRRNILTDSGGYQIFSLASLRRITEEGAEFRSHLDGSARRLTPEEVVAFQQLLGSDVLMPLDICTPPGIGEPEARQAVERTLAWAGRSLAAWKSGKAEKPGGLLFGIVQGNFFPELRRQSAERTAELDFPGLAIGGLSVGESFEVFRDLLALTAEKLPAERPRYLMGVGTPEYILEAVGNGIDMMDCVFPTRNARNAQAFTRRGTLNLRNEVHRLASEPIELGCTCPTCLRHSRSYLRHLFKSREILAAMLATRHNLHYLMSLMQDIRQAIREGRFSSFKRSFLQTYQMGLDEGAPDAEI